MILCGASRFFYCHNSLVTGIPFRSFFETTDLHGTFHGTSRKVFYFYDLSYYVPRAYCLEPRAERIVTRS